jgi:hypothetical protein
VFAYLKAEDCWDALLGYLVRHAGVGVGFNVPAFFQLLSKNCKKALSLPVPYALLLERIFNQNARSKFGLDAVEGHGKYGPRKQASRPREARRPSVSWFLPTYRVGGRFSSPAMQLHDLGNRPESFSSNCGG